MTGGTQQEIGADPGFFKGEVGWRDWHLWVAESIGYVPKNCNFRI